MGSPPSATTTDPQAYALYLQARHLGRQGTTRSFEQSITLFEQALAIAPDYVAAWDSLTEVYCEQTNRGLRPSEEGYALAREAANRSLAIDEDYPQSHARLAMIAINYDADLPAAARHLERALELDPTDLDILGHAAILAATLDRVDEAVALQECVIARDPVNARSHSRMGNFYLWAGRLDDAHASFLTALTLSPGYMGAQQMTGTVLLLKGEKDAALAAMQRETGKGWRLIGLVLAYHLLG